VASTAAKVSGKTILLGAATLIVAITATTIAYPLWKAKHRTPALDDYGVVPHFTLTDQDGKPFTDDAMRGHWTIVNFIFTRCDLQCPVSSLKMHRIQEETDDQPDLKLISFSVDPDYDTPPRLAAYATRYQADPSRWRFVTGPLADVKKVVTNAMMISMDSDGRTQPNGAPNIVHEPHFLLIDPELHIRGLYDSTAPDRHDAHHRDAADVAPAAASR
jgi:protein SCO1/2